MPKHPPRCGSRSTRGARNGRGMRSAKTPCCVLDTRSWVLHEFGGIFLAPYIGLLSKAYLKKEKKKEGGNGRGRVRPPTKIGPRSPSVSAVPVGTWDTVTEAENARRWQSRLPLPRGGRAVSAEICGRPITHKQLLLIHFFCECFTQRRHETLSASDFKQE